MNGLLIGAVIVAAAVALVGEVWTIFAFRFAADAADRLDDTAELEEEAAA